MVGQASLSTLDTGQLGLETLEYIRKDVEFLEPRIQVHEKFDIPPAFQDPLKIHFTYHHTIQTLHLSSHCKNTVLITSLYKHKMH